MPEKKKKFNLKEYQNKRKEKISIFGISAEFDWFFINIFTLVLVVVVFIFSTLELRNILDYEPEPDVLTNTILNDEKVYMDIDEIVSKFETEEIISETEPAEEIETEEN